MRRLALLLTVALFALTGCFSQPLTAPTTPLTYTWVMVYYGPDHHQWGAQIGLKTDAAGTTVAAYWWAGCPDSGPCAVSEFRRFYQVPPGTVLDASVGWCDGWCLNIAGQTLAVAPVGSPDGAVFQTASEKTAR